MAEDKALLVTSSYDNMIKFWTTNIPVWETSKALEIQKDQVVYRMKISHDKKYLVCASSKGIKLCDLNDENSYSIVCSSLCRKAILTTVAIARV